MEIKFVDSKSIKIKLTKEQWKQISSPEGIAKTLGQKDVIGFDLYDSDTLFGFAMLRKYSDTGWFLWDYAIDAKFQNKHYGQLALKKLIEYINLNYGATHIILYSFNSPQITFYKCNDAIYSSIKPH